MKNKLIFVLFIITIVIFIVYSARGIYINKTPSLVKNKVQAILEFNMEKPGERTKIDSAISEFLTRNISYKLVNGHIFSAHYIYGLSSSKNGSDIVAYIWSVQREFISNNGYKKFGAFVSNPMKLMLEKTSTGNFRVTNSATPTEGPEYEDSIIDMFPNEYIERIMQKENERELIVLVNNNIASYSVD